MSMLYELDKREEQTGFDLFCLTIMKMKPLPRMNERMVIPILFF